MATATVPTKFGEDTLQASLDRSPPILRTSSPDALILVADEAGFHPLPGDQLSERCESEQRELEHCVPTKLTSRLMDRGDTPPLVEEDDYDNEVEDDCMNKNDELTFAMENLTYLPVENKSPGCGREKLFSVTISPKQLRATIETRRIVKERDQDESIEAGAEAETETETECGGRYAEPVCKVYPGTDIDITSPKDVKTPPQLQSLIQTVGTRDGMPPHASYMNVPKQSCGFLAKGEPLEACGTKGLLQQQLLSQHDSDVRGVCHSNGPPPAILLTRPVNPPPPLTGDIDHPTKITLTSTPLSSIGENAGGMILSGFTPPLNLLTAGPPKKVGEIDAAGSSALAVAANETHSHSTLDPGAGVLVVAPEAPSSRSSSYDAWLYHNRSAAHHRPKVYCAVFGSMEQQGSYGDSNASQRLQERQPMIRRKDDGNGVKKCLTSASEEEQIQVKQESVLKSQQLCSSDACVGSQQCVQVSDEREAKIPTGFQRSGGFPEKSPVSERQCDPLPPSDDTGPLKLTGGQSDQIVSILRHSRMSSSRPVEDSNQVSVLEDKAASKEKKVKVKNQAATFEGKGQGAGNGIEMFRPSCDAYTPRLKKAPKFKPAPERESVSTHSMGTIQRPNFRDALRRVSMIIHQHVFRIERRFEADGNTILESGLFLPSMRDEFHEDRFVTPRFKCTLVRVPASMPGVLCVKKRIKTEYVIPTEAEIYEFAHQLFKAVQLSSECSIVCLIYIERLMEVAKVPLLGTTWRPVFMAGLLLASKVWQDLSSWNVEFASVYPQYGLDAINRLELLFLRKVKWDLYISSSLYAKYYFALRSLLEKQDFRRRYYRMVGGVGQVDASQALKIQQRTEVVKEEALMQISRSM